MRTLARLSPGLLAVLIALVPVAPASAATTHTSSPDLASNQGIVIAQAGLYVRAAQIAPPPSTSLPIVGYLAYDQVVTIRCYYTGQWITGPYGPTNIWDSIIGYQTDQYDGVASDAWIYTGSNTPQVPPCGGP